MGRGRSEDRRLQILDATCSVVLEHGFAATRVADVAGALGVSTGLIHYHFASKEALLAEAFRSAAEADLARLEASVARVRTGAVAKLDRLFRLSCPSGGDPAWRLWIEVWGEALRKPELRRASADLDVRWQAALEAIVVEGVEGGELRCEDPAGTAWRLLALLDGLAVQVVVHRGLLRRRDMLDWARRVAAHEVGVDPGAFGATGRRLPPGRSG